MNVNTYACAMRDKEPGVFEGHLHGCKSLFGLSAYLGDARIDVQWGSLLCDGQSLESYDLML
jgi:hypothetical protein